jgi:hypothetical protein
MELERLMERHPTTLGSFLWIVGLQNENYSPAVQSLLQNASESVDTVGQTKIHMGFAKIANTLVQQERENAQNVVRIEKIRERANAQLELLGDNKQNESQPLQSAEELLNYALAELKRQPTRDGKVSTGTCALAVCTTFDKLDDGQRGAVQVWLEALQADIRYFRQFVFHASHIDIVAVQSTTVFGALYAQTLDIPEWEDVVFRSPAVGDRLLEELLPEDRAGLIQLQRALSSSSQ